MRACLQIDLKLLKKNTQTLFNITAKEKGFFCPVVKANAYGHGALKIAKALKRAKVKNISVVSLSEALELKDLAGDINIHILGPVEKALEKEQIPLLHKYGFIPLVGQWEDLKTLANFKQTKVTKSLPFHLKFNTGMNRFGFAPNKIPSDTKKLWHYIKKHPHLQLKGIASHLSEGEKASSLKTGSAFKQMQIFKQIIPFFKAHIPHLQVHLLNSAGWFALWSHSHTSELSLGFRPGISLYGIKPPVDFLSQKAKKKYQALPLKPIACLKSFVVQAYKVGAGEPVSYGGIWKAQKKSHIAVVSMGYADGLPYHLCNKGEVLFRGQRARMVGRICMDYFMIDVSRQAKLGEIKKGEEVCLFGPQGDKVISLEEQMAKVKSIPEELITRLGPRVTRLYQN